MYFLENPHLIAQDGSLAMSSGIWFYMTPQDPKPSMHDVMTGFFVPNDIDIQKILEQTLALQPISSTED